MNSNQLRQAFLDYFKNKQHTIVASSPLVPGNDPTLLFTNAGMVQFKDVFLGSETRSYNRATSSQRCVRAGGKHNDLENVGYTARHHTFFEMLGNFSFGDYFKREAIQYAWDFLTNVLKIPKEKLWVTVFKDDHEAEKIWLEEIGVDPNRISRCDEADNFWSMGDTGPCGPCTEIFYDHGEHIPGGPPGSEDGDLDRYIEIWNLVFMQYERTADGKLTPLPKPSVDTGSGLERLAAVMQGVSNNYDTDLFKPIIKAVADIANVKDLTTTSLRVIADHIRSCSFLITDGVIPSNEGRGYVLRRIIRRAIRHGNKLGLHDPFFYKLVASLVEQMGAAYPELTKAQTTIERILLQEEQQFIRTLDTGLKLLEQYIAEHPNVKVIPGEIIFKLYDTYGFPVDLTADFTREKNLTIDVEGFETEMAKQRQKSQQASKFEIDYTEQLAIKADTDFMGYQHLTHEATVVALLCDNQPADSLQTNADSIVVLDKTPFYPEGGGQVGDQGWLFGPNGQFQVKNTYKKGQAILHVGQLTQGTLQAGEKIHAEVDIAKRNATALNHSATHLLHAALRQVLGEHVMQKGSLVEPERLRFDFTHFAPLTDEQMQTVERLVNQQIRLNLAVETGIMSPEEAKKAGALAFFGEKYGENVRVLSMGEFSKELCGGTHVKRTGDIGLFKITFEGGVAAGIRRIEAITGEYACSWVEILQQQLQEVTQLFKTDRESLIEKIKKSVQNTQQIEKQLQQLQNRLANSALNDLMDKAVDIKSTQVLVAELSGLDAKGLREAIDHLKSKWGSAVIVLGNINEGRVQLVAGVSKDLVTHIKANDLINSIADHIGGKGGGRPDFAQAGGHNVNELQKALDAAMAWIKTNL